MADKDSDAEAASRKRRMGPREQGGGYASQRFDIDFHSGSYGGNEGAGGGHWVERGGAATTLKGQQHMSGRYGDKAYGRSDDGTSNIPRDPSQHNGPVAASGGGRENERDSPGISNDERSDVIKP